MKNIALRFGPLAGTKIDLNDSIIKVVSLQVDDGRELRYERLGKPDREGREIFAYVPAITAPYRAEQKSESARRTLSEYMVSYPTPKTANFLAAETGISLGTTKSVLAILSLKGQLIRTVQRSAKGQRQFLYTVKI